MFVPEKEEHAAVYQPALEVFVGMSHKRNRMRQ